MKLMAGSLVAVWKLFSEWTERELSYAEPRGGARALGLCRADDVVGGPGVRAAGGSSPGEEGFRGIGAVRGAGRASVPFCFLAVVGGRGGTTTGSGTMGGPELPDGAGGGWTGRNDWV